MTGTASSRGMSVFDVDIHRNQEWLRRRKLRLEQVRKQSNEIAKALRQKVINEEKARLNEYDRMSEARFNDWKAEKLEELERKFRDALEEFGKSYKLAEAEPDPEEVLEEKYKMNMAKAQLRGEIAQQEELRRRKIAEEQKMSLIQRKKLVRKKEDLRSALIHSVPNKKQIIDTQNVPDEKNVPEKVTSSPVKKRATPTTTVRSQNVGDFQKKANTNVGRRKKPTSQKSCMCKQKPKPPEYCPFKGSDTIWINLNEIRDSSTGDSGAQATSSKSSLGNEKSQKEKPDGVVEFYDFSSRFYRKSFKEFPHLVQRIEPELETPNANDLAEIEHEERKEEAKKKLEADTVSQERGAEALRREKINQDYQNLIAKLEELNRKEKILKAQQRNFPNFLHMTDERLSEKLKAKQKLMDNKFENIYFDTFSQIPREELPLAKPFCCDGGGDFGTDDGSSRRSSVFPARLKTNTPATTDGEEPCVVASPDGTVRKLKKPKREKELLLNIDKALKEGRELRKAISKSHDSEDGEEGEGNRVTGQSRSEAEMPAEDLFPCKEEGKTTRSKEEGKTTRSKEEGKTTKSKEEGKTTRSKEEGKTTRSKEEGKTTRSKEEGKTTRSKEEGKTTRSKEEGKMTRCQESQTEDLKQVEVSVADMNFRKTGDDSLPMSTSTSYKSPPSVIRSNRLRQFLEYLEGVTEVEDVGSKFNNKVDKLLHDLFCKSKSNNQVVEEEVEEEEENSNPSPTLEYYIEKLLTMSRECIADLSISSETVSTPNTVDMDVKAAEHSCEGSARGEDLIRKSRLERADRLEETIKNWKRILERNSERPSEVGDVPDYPQPEPAQRVEDEPGGEKPEGSVCVIYSPHISSRYEEITKKCSERISELSSMLDKVRKDKEKLLSSASDDSSQSLNKDEGNSGKEFDVEEAEEDEEVEEEEEEVEEEPLQRCVGAVKEPRASLVEGYINRYSLSRPRKETVSTTAVADSQSLEDSLESWPDVMDELLRRKILTSPFKWCDGEFSSELSPVSESHTRPSSIETVIGNFRKEISKIKPFTLSDSFPQPESFLKSLSFDERNRELFARVKRKTSSRWAGATTSDRGGVFQEESSVESINQALTTLGLNWAKSFLRKNEESRAISSSSNSEEKSSGDEADVYA